MNVTVNGEQRLLEKPCTVQELLQQCGLDKSPCAVEVNRKIVPKRSHEAHILAEGDTIEIVTLVGGG